MRDSWPLARCCRRVIDQALTNAGCVPEFLLLGKKSYADITSPDLVRLEMMASPLLSRGWLATASDLNGSSATV